ncbi:Growth factor receptor domain-containing protein [Mycena indigotica]|uniref:Growth factor receptor domain-containing protein n=1 Tax=Mycena indigotica TaxID=2126181 RepID=A0A8H6VXP6_9AGAR|nr:Growth factor receptor domain-containing protein [Mycena indigotica]KAF7291999.1 Growth factor receptor domain-containing protein [Mycena indigotica]
MLLPLLQTTSNVSTIVCALGQCLQGYSNTSIGVTLSSPGSQSALLLPGQYTTTTNPQFLHNLLTSSSVNLTSSPGFKNSTLATGLPLNVVQEPGLAIYAEPIFGGQAAFSSIPSSPVNNRSTPLTSRSLSLSSSVWIAVNSPAGGNNRVIIWDSIPDTAQLPTSGPPIGSLTLFDIESAACNPSCSSAGICSSTGTCTCSPGFTGPSCETCAPGFFGPNCKACPSGCAKCDDGPAGTGRCLVSQTASSCNCVNGVCGANGSCTCTTGFTTAANGTACSKCATGFFLDSKGDCSVCQIGCSACADGSGECTTCKNGFTQDANDKTKCNALPEVNSAGTTCPPGSFADGQNCSPCSPSCKTCTGGTSNDCVLCASGTFTLNNTCVSADTNGVCQGTSLIANNNKAECDSCGSKCTSCKIPNFNSASTVNQLQCTGCITGFVLSNGTCVPECPAGTFLSPQDNLTCTACDSSCATCSGSSNFCLSCGSNQLASDGKCVASCPSNTFSASGSCISCHSDCATCSGSAFNQCASCPPSRPVLANGRCLPTCSKNAFFDATSGSQCLACASNKQVLRAGTCAAASCDQVVPGLGACLSEFVTTTSGSLAPFPSVTGINTPTLGNGGRRRLEWWEILLMTLGCAFIFIVVLWLCRRRRARKQATAQRRTFQLQAVRPDHQGGWRWKLLRFGEKLFGHRRSHRVVPMDISRPMDLELGGLKTQPRPQPRPQRREKRGREDYQQRQHLLESTTSRSLSDHSAPSIYSQMTGVPPRMPEPRQPVRHVPEVPADVRLSSSTIATYYMTTAPVAPRAGRDRQHIERF